MKTDAERFWAKVDKTDGCWNWTACTSHGYGQFKLSKAEKTVRAHRFSYFLHYGEFDPKWRVLHSCDNPPCVNPAHLRLGTDADNARDRDDRGRNGNANKTHCPQGHPYSGANLYIASTGKRLCRTCAVAVQATRPRHHPQNFGAASADSKN